MIIGQDWCPDRSRCGHPFESVSLGSHPCVRSAEASRVASGHLSRGVPSGEPRARFGSVRVDRIRAVRSDILTDNHCRDQTLQGVLNRTTRLKPAFTALHSTVDLFVCFGHKLQQRSGVHSSRVLCDCLFRTCFADCPTVSSTQLPMTANTAWADAIGKVLASQPKTKSVILAKAKKDKDVSSKRKTDDHDQLEIVQDDGSVVRVQDKTGIEDTRPRKKAKLSKHEWDVMGKLKPKTEDKEMERRLCSIATKGVVQLFNAVREQQTAIESKIKEVGTSETKRDKALAQFDKRQFLDKLKNKNKVFDVKSLFKVPIIIFLF